MTRAATETHSDPPAHEPSRAAKKVFNEGVMGFLALVALGTALGPLVFDVSPGAERLLTVVEWLLVAAFAAEFVFHGYERNFSVEWRRSPWRIVDLVTILGPIAALLPQVSDLARGSLVLRMLRVVRAVMFGTRAGSVAARKQQAKVHRAAAAPTLTLLRAGDGGPVSSDWHSFLAWTREPGESWFHASNLDAQRFRELALAAGVSVQDLDHMLGEEGHAKLRQHTHSSTLVLQLPTVTEQGEPAVERDRLLAIITGRGLLTATEGSLDLPRTVVTEATSLSKIAFPARITCAILALVRDRHATVAQRFDDEVHRLEAMAGGVELLRRTFRLRQEISSATLDLWHVKAVVRSLADGKAKLSGVDLREEKYMDELLAETDSLFESLNRNKEELKTLIELHINFKSFEMNYFLKVLAVISALGLIPAVAGGLLGMNVAGNPWPVTLGQVTLGVTMGMASALYVFAVKGWLK